MTQNMAKHPLKPFPPSNSPGTRPPARGTAHLWRCLRGHICAALARFRPPWRLCLARMRHLTWLLAHEGRARHFPRRGSEGKKLGRYSRGNQGLEELADWLPQLYTRISSRCLGGALAPQRQYRGEETRPALVRSTDLIRKELRWADKQPHSVQWGASRSRCTSFAEATQPVD